jgi:error-prone DNA polymerase
MGFWSPHTLVQDARRHGVTVYHPDLNASLAGATLESCTGSTGGVAVRLGLASVRGIGDDLAKAIEDERRRGGPYRSIEDLVQRVDNVTLPQLEALATADAFGCFAVDRRQAIWAAGAAIESRPGRLPGLSTATAPPRLPGMETVEEAVADLWALGISPDGHPTQYLRERLARLGVSTALDLRTAEPGGRVVVAGVVTHRQRPMTAQGTTFLNLEDETGLVNVVVSKGCWNRYRRVAREAPAMTIRGRLERAEGVVNVVAEELTALTLPAGSIHKSRDFH